MIKNMFLKKSLKILIPCDLSSKSSTIFNTLKILNLKYSIEVTVIHVIDSFLPNLLINKLDEKNHQLLLNWSKNLPQEVKLRNLIIEKGNVTEEIVRASKKYKSDFILFEDTKKYFHKHQIGTIREQTLRYSDLSVWVAKSKKLKKIMCCVDGSESSKKALQSAIQLSKKFNCSLTLLYVLPKIDFNPYGLDNHIVVQLNKEFKTKWTNNINKFLNQFNFKDIKKLDRIYERGMPSTSILDVAEEKKYDLILMGAKGHSLLHDFFVGSTVEKVMPFSICSVLIVK